MYLPVFVVAVKLDFQRVSMVGGTTTMGFHPHCIEITLSSFIKKSLLLHHHNDLVLSVSAADGGGGGGV